MKPRATLGTEFVLLAALWGSSFMFMRIGASEFGAWATAGVRVAVASIFLLPVLWWSGQASQLRRHGRPILLVGILNSALPFALYAYALQSISSGLTAILNATAPLMGAVVAWLWLHERPGLQRTLGLIIGFFGVVLLSWDKAMAGAGTSLWAILACLGATLCYGLAASMTQKHLTGVHPLATATGSQLGASILLIAPAIHQWPTTPPSAKAWLALLAVGVLCTGIAYILFFRLIEKNGPSKAMTVTFLIPVFALLYGNLLLDEVVTVSMLAGCAVILLGVALALANRKRHGST